MMSEKRAGSITNRMREELIKQYGTECPICGRDDVKLDVCHIIPIRKGGDNSVDNLILLCPTCHQAMDQTSDIREWEFVDFLVKLMERNTGYRNIDTGNRLDKASEYCADIVADEMDQDVWQKIVIECKSYSAFTSERMEALIKQLNTYRQYILHNTKRVLAFPGRLSSDSSEVLNKSGIEVWDIGTIASIFRDQIPLVPHPRLQPLFMSGVSSPKISPEEKLIQELKSIAPGRAEWPRYQSHIASVLERLFCPPLSSPILELSDYSKVNRRDIILPNYAEEGFWAFARDVYSAFYIVVDAKNYVGKVKKEQALQLSNYLKDHGAGLFGMIICRKGGDKGCIHTLREVWGFYRKLILVITDDDIEQMLLAKSANGQPEVIIRQRIEELRLSL